MASSRPGQQSVPERHPLRSDAEWIAHSEEYKAILERSSLNLGHLKLLVPVHSERDASEFPGGVTALARCEKIVYPLLDSGLPMCFAWIARGECYESCGRHKGHRKTALSPAEHVQAADFLREVAAAMPKN